MGGAFRIWGLSYFFCLGFFRERGFFFAHVAGVSLVKSIASLSSLFNLIFAWYWFVDFVQQGRRSFLPPLVRWFRSWVRPSANIFCGQPCSSSIVFPCCLPMILLGLNAQYLLAQ